MRYRIKSLYDNKLDNMHSAYSSMIKKFAMNARATRDKNAFAIYRNAFTTTLTSDGQPLVSATHITLTGLTVDNLIVGALSPTTLDLAIVRLIEQESEDGVVMGMEPAYLLVAPSNYTNARQIVDSTLVSNSAANAVNIYASTYNIQVFRSPYLGAAQGGSNTAWFLLSRNHAVTRYIREAVSTELVDYIYSNNDEYVYKGRFRETYGATNYIGIVGSLG